MKMENKIIAKTCKCTQFFYLLSLTYVGIPERKKVLINTHHVHSLVTSNHIHVYINILHQSLINNILLGILILEKNLSFQQPNEKITQRKHLQFR